MGTLSVRVPEKRMLSQRACYAQQATASSQTALESTPIHYNTNINLDGCR